MYQIGVPNRQKAIKKTCSVNDKPYLQSNDGQWTEN